MRVTNLMTTNQLLLNLSKNMTALSFLEYQGMTGNKIRYASDNPIIAGRSLKFRTNLVETEQYLANVDQGRSWLQTTANAVKNVLEAISNTGENSIRTLCVNASNSGLQTITDAKIFANQLKETLTELMGEFNTSYAGRYVFSGFKTDERVVFDTDDPRLKMDITQSFSLKDINMDYRVYIKTDAIVDVDEYKVAQSVPAGMNLDAEAMPQEISVKRLKLPYDVNINNVSLPDFADFTITTKNSATDADAYLPGVNEIYFIEDTGELIFGNSVAGEFKSETESVLASFNAITDAASQTKAIADATALLAKLTNVTSDPKGTVAATIADINDAIAKANDITDPTDPYDTNLILAQGAMQTARNKASQAVYPDAFNVNYTKTGFYSGEINPKVYFDCTDVNTGKSYSMNNQVIKYEFGINNKMQVNSLAKDILTPQLINDIMDVVKLVEGISTSNKDDLISKFMGAPDNRSKEDAEKLADEQITDETKFYLDMIGTKLTKLIGKVDSHITNISIQNTSLGSRLQRLDLISNRLQDDRINFQDLKAKNDNADMEEVYIKYSSMVSVYNSALQMGARVVQMSLVNFI